jgi:hypothetical protein
MDAGVFFIGIYVFGLAHVLPPAKARRHVMHACTHARTATCGVSSVNKMPAPPTTQAE